MLIHSFFFFFWYSTTLALGKNEQTMPQGLRAALEKHLRLVVQMQCEDNVGTYIQMTPRKPAWTFTEFCRSRYTCPNYFGAYLFCRPVSNPVFVLPFPAQQECLFPFVLPFPFLYFLTTDFCILVSTKSTESSLTINRLFRQFCCCRK